MIKMTYCSKTLRPLKENHIRGEVVLVIFVLFEYFINKKNLNLKKLVLKQRFLFCYLKVIT